MATGFSDKAPPPFDAKTDDYQKWKRKFDLWQSITDVTKVKQGPLLVLRLDDDTQDTIMEHVPAADIKKEDGIDKVINQLGQMFKKDESVEAFELYEEMESYRRPANMPISTYCSEFHKRWSKVKASGTTLSESVLAFRLLKSANLCESDEQLVKVTISKMDYESMAKQLKRVVNNIATPESAGPRIKEEPEDHL